MPLFGEGSERAARVTKCCPSYLEYTELWEPRFSPVVSALIGRLELSSVGQVAVPGAEGDMQSPAFGLDKTSSGRLAIYQAQVLRMHTCKSQH